MGALGVEQEPHEEGVTLTLTLTLIGVEQEPHEEGVLFLKLKSPLKELEAEAITTNLNPNPNPNPNPDPNSDTIWRPPLILLVSTER